VSGKVREFDHDWRVATLSVKNFADPVTVHTHEYVYIINFTELNLHVFSKFGNNCLEHNITTKSEVKV